MKPIDEIGSSSSIKNHGMTGQNNLLFLRNKKKESSLSVSIRVDRESLSRIKHTFSISPKPRLSLENSERFKKAQREIQKGQGIARYRLSTDSSLEKKYHERSRISIKT